MKVFNDPVHGFISIRSSLIGELIDHPYFQKLRRIRQLGLSDFVYPGAVHNRFQHALGAMHLTAKALELLQSKGIQISEEEFEGCLIAILLHDVGHGPFSHSLEETLLQGVSHESISYQMMQNLNEEFNGRLKLAMLIFRDGYPRKFLHQLISSQLDMDRLDYLTRDSFYTGVPEGSINAQRIIQLLNVVDDQLVVEEKAIYTVENFLNARRLMYWQVYLHKTSVGAEKLITNLLKRGRDLVRSGKDLPMTISLSYFFKNSIGLNELTSDPEAMNHFSKLDDSDIWAAAKLWVESDDRIVSELSKMLLSRKLFKVKLSNEPISKKEIHDIKLKVAEHLNILIKDTHYFVSHGPVKNEAYTSGGKAIRLLTKSGKITDIVNKADLPNIKAMSQTVLKHHQCWPKFIQTDKH